MSGAVIRAWMDVEGRVWMDTGRTHMRTREPMIELLNGAACGALGWVHMKFGPLEPLGAKRPGQAYPVSKKMLTYWRERPDDHPEHDEAESEHDAAEPDEDSAL